MEDTFKDHITPGYEHNNCCYNNNICWLSPPIYY